MVLAGFLPASSRRTFVALGLVTVAGVSGVSAREASTHGTPPPAQQAPPAPQAAPAQDVDPLKFNTDLPLLLVNRVKKDKAADFEAAWKTIRAGLAKSDKPEVKAFGETLSKFYKVDADAGASVFYIFDLTPPSKTHSYNFVKVLYDTGAFTREESDALYAKLKECYEQINPWPLVKIG
jgi:hypothetical protein